MTRVPLRSLNFLLKVASRVFCLPRCALSTPPFGRDPIGPRYGLPSLSDGRLQHTSALLRHGRIFHTRLHRHRKYQHRPHKADIQTVNFPDSKVRQAPQTGVHS
jgi:hypothetical protein